jgi:hypothetical protein
MMHLDHYIRLSRQAQVALADAWSKLADGHRDEADVRLLARRFATSTNDHGKQLDTFVGKHDGSSSTEAPENFDALTFRGTRTGGLGLLRDLHDITLLTTECDLMWMLLAVGAQGVHDSELLDLSRAGQTDTKSQLDWLQSRMKQTAPQALLVAD